MPSDALSPHQTMTLLRYNKRSGIKLIKLKLD